MKEGDLLHKQTHFIFNPANNGGESLVLETKFIANGNPVSDKGQHFFTNQVLTLNSYCNSASFTLFGAQFTPDILRKLADELEAIEESLKNGT